MRRSLEVRRLAELACQRPHEVPSFLEQLEGYSEAEIIYGLNTYLGKQLKEKGYSWHYAVGVVKKQAEVIRRESKNATPLPPLRNT